jgi:hypothetical protein
MVEAGEEDDEERVALRGFEQVELEEGYAVAR